jgi:CRISP-associated protein Cas1
MDFENYKNRPLDDVSEYLMGIEGNAAKCYWQAIAECMPVDFRFENRNRHPAEDAFNAAINYLYGILYTIVETAIFSVGLDPYLGIMHADQYNKPTLSYDLIEPFRPWVDRVVIEGILQDEVKQSFFEKKEDAVILSKLGKQYFIPKFNLFMAAVGEFQHTKTTRKNHVYRQVGELVDILNEKYK